MTTRNFTIPYEDLVAAGKVVANARTSSIVTTVRCSHAMPTRPATASGCQPADQEGHDCERARLRAHRCR
jgi:hypothetical protein